MARHCSRRCQGEARQRNGLIPKVSRDRATKHQPSGLQGGSLQARQNQINANMKIEIETDEFNAFFDDVIGEIPGRDALELIRNHASLLRKIIPHKNRGTRSREKPWGKAVSDIIEGDPPRKPREAIKPSGESTRPGLSETELKQLLSMPTKALHEIIDKEREAGFKSMDHGKAYVARVRGVGIRHLVFCPSRDWWAYWEGDKLIGLSTMEATPLEWAAIMHT